MSTLQRPDTFPADATVVELTWRKDRIEHWIRFGDVIAEQRIGREKRVVGFAPGSLFAFVRWAANDYGTVISRIDIVRAVRKGEACQTLPFVRPGGDILLKLHGWPKVETVLFAIDAIEALGIKPAEVSPDHWRHLHHRLSVNEPYHAYSREQHRAWRKRAALGDVDDDGEGR